MKFYFKITTNDILVEILISRGQDLGTREQPVGANSVFQHSELMVTIVNILFFYMVV